MAKSNGPDDFGYYSFDQKNGCDYSFHDIATTGTVILTAEDDTQISQNLGIAGFKLYGTAIASITVDSNGYLTTMAGDSDASNDCTIPRPPSTANGRVANSGDRIYVLHDDLITTVYYQHFNVCPRVSDASSAPAACDVFQWNGHYFYADTKNVVAQAILYEGSNEVALQYKTAEQSGEKSTTGMLKNGSLDGHVYTCNRLNSIIAGKTAVCMLPPTPMSACNGTVSIINNERFSPFSNYTCDATTSIASGNNGVVVEPNAVVNLRAPKVTMNPPFKVRLGGVLNAGPAKPACAGIDTDGDRLDDCVETNTGIYVDENNTGTSPTLADTDGDSIDDGDEVLGTLAGLNLPAMGTNPLRKNILIEYDWFDDALDPAICAAHSHRPTADMMRMVEQAFARAPITNVDGTTGITIIQDYGQGGLFNKGNKVIDADGVLDGGVNGAEFIARKGANFDTNRQGYFHYTLLPHRYNTASNSSGQAEWPGNDLIVSLYCQPQPDDNKDYAHTILHELGHNLNLGHGGDTGINHKPNYNSVMNYDYQFPGVDGNCTPAADGPLDYSHGSNIDLDENNLNENLGICGHTATKDWDENGVSTDTNVSIDINGDGNKTILKDYNDWANLYFAGIVSNLDGASLASPRVASCDNAPVHPASQQPGQPTVPNNKK